MFGISCDNNTVRKNQMASIGINVIFIINVTKRNKILETVAVDWLKHKLNAIEE